MILLNNAICYSPRPPSGYVVEGLGPGLAFSKRERLPLWNLVWLSVPYVDFFHSGHKANEVPSEAWKLVGYLLPLLGAFYKCAKKEGAAEIPYLLTLEPMDFIEAFEDLPWTTMTPAHAIPNWKEVMLRRAQKAALNPLPLHSLQLTSDQGHTLCVSIPQYTENA